MSILRGIHVWSHTGVGTGSGVTVTHDDANTTNVSCVTGIQVSGDAAAVVTIESPASTVLFTLRYAAAFDRAYTFPPKTIRTLAGNPVLVKISASSSHCEANIQGFTIQ